DALRGYRTELATNPDRPASWVGLGLALSALNTNPPAAKALLHHPELVRAVHRKIRTMTDAEPAPEDLATWIGRFTY
ncbi:MAG TPA: HEXXH motif domain-containing protein, partial [Micromonosporaceae bacterium]|nr:HEXXH motif domain-containing protein [Micromonosporaceae bacterium]